MDERTHPLGAAGVLRLARGLAVGPRVQGRRASRPLRRGEPLRRCRVLGEGARLRTPGTAARADARARPAASPATAALDCGGGHSRGRACGGRRVPAAPVGHDQRPPAKRHLAAAGARPRRCRSRDRGTVRRDAPGGEEGKAGEAGQATNPPLAFRNVFDRDEPADRRRGRRPFPLMPPARRPRPRGRRPNGTRRRPPRPSRRRPAQRPRAHSRHPANSERGHMRRRPMQTDRSPLMLRTLLGAHCLLAFLRANRVRGRQTPSIVAYPSTAFLEPTVGTRGSTHGNFVVVHWSDPRSRSSINTRRSASRAVPVPGPSPASHSDMLALQMTTEQRSITTKHSSRSTPIRRPA